MWSTSIRRLNGDSQLSLASAIRTPFGQWLTSTLALALAWHTLCQWGSFPSLQVSYLTSHAYISHSTFDILSYELNFETKIFYEGASTLEITWNSYTNIRHELGALSNLWLVIYEVCSAQNRLNDHAVTASSPTFFIDHSCCLCNLLLSLFCSLVL